VLIDATINLDYDPDPDFGWQAFSAHGVARAGRRGCGNRALARAGLGKWKPD
jgi:hypothetical protein